MDRNDLVLMTPDGSTVLALGRDLNWAALRGSAEFAPAVVGAAWAPDPWAETAKAAELDGWRVLAPSAHPPRSANTPAEADARAEV